MSLQPLGFAQVPVITSQPQPQTNLIGGRAIFRAMAKGRAPLRYRWRENGTPVADATNDVLVLRALRFTHEAQYSVVVSNAYGAVTSVTASLSVRVRQVGQLVAIGQNAVTGVIGQQVATAPQLALIPADPLLPRLEVPGGGAPAQAGQPLALESGHVTQVLADQGGVLEVKVLADRLLPAGLFGRADQPDFQPFEDGPFVGLWQSKWFAHAEKRAEPGEGCAVFSARFCTQALSKGLTLNQTWERKTRHRRSQIRGFPSVEVVSNRRWG